MDGTDTTAVGMILRVVRERAVFPLFQPIVELATGKIVGAEALARGPAGTVMESVAGLFAAARQAGMLSMVDQLCFARAIEEARQAGDDAPPLLFVNMEPEVADRPIEPELLDTVRAPRRFQIVMEYAERSLESQTAALVMLAGLAYADGNSVALDDVGAEPMSVAMLPVLEPAVIKLDASLLRDPECPATVDVVSIVDAYVERTGATVVAEGVETEGDLATAQRLGAVWGQGWLFGKPGPLSDLVGRETLSTPVLRSPSPYVPEGAAFAYVAEHEDVRSIDVQTLGKFANDVLHVAAAGGPHAIVVAVCSDDTVRAAVETELAAVEKTAAYVRAGPAHSVHVQTPPETALVAISPHAVAALCARPSGQGRFDVVGTSDRAKAHTVARMLINSVSPFPRF